MAQRCKVCAHPKRAQIELALARKVALRIIAAKYDLNLDPLHRHRRNHMGPELLARLGAAGRPTEIDLNQLREAESEGLLQSLVHQRARLFQLLDMATEVGDYKGANGIEKTILEHQHLLAKLLGELVNHTKITQNNLMVSPDYLMLRSRLIQALRPFPDARQAAAKVLADLEGREPHFDGIAGCLNGAADPPMIEGESRRAGR